LPGGKHVHGLHGRPGWSGRIIPGADGTETPQLKSPEKIGRAPGWARTGSGRCSSFLLPPVATPGGTRRPHAFERPAQEPASSRASSPRRPNLSIPKNKETGCVSGRVHLCPAIAALMAVCVRKRGTRERRRRRRSTIRRLHWSFFRECSDVLCLDLTAWIYSLLLGMSPRSPGPRPARANAGPTVSVRFCFNWKSASADLSR